MVSSEEAETTGDELVARMYVETIVNSGGAIGLMDAYSTHNQSCNYVYGILQHVAYDETEGGIDPAVRVFARNLLDDWSK